MLPPPAVFVGGGETTEGGISSEINLKNGFSLRLSICASSEYYEVNTLSETPLVAHGLLCPRIVGGVLS